MSRKEDVINAMEIFNMICDVEDSIAEGAEFEGLDIELMEKTKNDAKNFINNFARRK